MAKFLPNWRVSVNSKARLETKFNFNTFYVLFQNGIIIMLPSRTGVGIRDRVRGIPRSRSRKSGTRTGTHNKIRDWDWDSYSKFAGFKTGTQICGTQNSGTQLFGTVPKTYEIRYAVPGTENFPRHGPGPVPTPDSEFKPFERVSKIKLCDICPML